MKKAVIYFLFILLVGITISCEKENSNLGLINSQEQNISLKSNRLVFQDQNTFDQTYEMLAQMNSEELDEWENQYHKGSIRQINKQIRMDNIYVIDSMDSPEDTLLLKTEKN